MNLPFAEYKDFQDCLNKNKDKDDPSAYCGSIKHKVEKSLESIDSTKIEEALKVLEDIDQNKESGKITQEQHDEESKKVLEELDKGKMIHSEIKKLFGKKPKTLPPSSDPLSHQYSAPPLVSRQPKKEPRPLMKAMTSRVGKRRVIMTRADGIKQHYFMNPEEIKANRAKGLNVEELPEGGEPDKEKTVAVDFDGTIVKLENPEILQEGAKEGLQQIADMGYTIIIFSGRGTKDLEARLAKLGIDTYDYINDNPEERQDNPGKVVASKYIDDKNLEFKGNWKEMVSRLQGDTMKKQIDNDPGEAQEDLGGTVTHVARKEKPNLHRQSQEELNEESEEIPIRPPKIEKEDDFTSDLRYQLIAEAMKILDKCPKCKEMPKDQKIKILQDTINTINPNIEDKIKEEYMPELKKEADSPVAPAAPAPKDPLAEIKELIAGLAQKVGAMEGHMAKYDPGYGRGVDGKAHGAPMTEETAVQGGPPGATAPKEELKPATVNKEDESKLEKAEPVKTLPVFPGQKKQEDKELGPDKVSGAQYLNKEDVEAFMGNLIKKMGFTETPKTYEPVAHPLEKVDATVPKLDMSSIATMKFDKVEEIAARMRGGVRY